ncbi:MAG TPA: ABC transporter permease [Anaeromyxobacteraceae bacterium]|nr:ABC transporter permease [Anaeromyxobacteraceae bacterium]
MGRRFRLLYGGLVVLLATAAALAAATLVLSAIGAKPFATFVVILTGPLHDLFGVTEILVRAVPLILVALGIAISFRSGILNIGAEGQIMIGILSGTAVALAGPGLPRLFLLPLCLLAGALGGALWGGIAGVLRARLDVNEILSTVMLNYIAAQLYTFLLRGPMIDPNELMTGSGTPQSTRLPHNAWLDRIIPGTRLHSGIYLALGLAFLVWFLLWRTTLGFRLRAAGAGSKAARYAGIHVERSLVLAMLMAGGFAGLAGAVEVAGVHHRAIEAISGGYGFAGIVVALFGGLHPAGIVPAAVFFGLLLVGADMTQRSAGVPANMILVLQGVVILAIVSAKMYLRNPYAQDRAFRLLRRMGLVRDARAGEAGELSAGAEP